MKVCLETIKQILPVDIGQHVFLETVFKKISYHRETNYAYLQKAYITEKCYNPKIRVYGSKQIHSCGKTKAVRTFFLKNWEYLSFYQQF